MGALSLSLSLSLSLQCEGFSMWCSSYCRAQASGLAAHGLNSCQWAPERRLSSCGTQLVALWHVGSSWTRNQTIVPCFARQILNHWTTRETPLFFFFFLISEGKIHYYIIFTSTLNVRILKSKVEISHLLGQVQNKNSNRSLSLQGHCFPRVL